MYIIISFYEGLMVTTNLHVRLLMSARCVFERRHSRLQKKIRTLSIRYKVYVLSMFVSIYS